MNELLDNLIRYVANRLLYGMTPKEIVKDLAPAVEPDVVWLAIKAAEVLNKYRK